jgi:AraC-like DNA-binding protein
VIGDILSSHPARSHYVRRAESYINTAYMQDITVENIAKMLSLDRRYLSRIFKAKNGVSIKEYITARRLEGAARLLKAGYCVSEAASMCGYGDTANFSKSFKRRFGVPPSKY